MVFISVGGVIVYRVIMTVDYCSDDESSSSIECLLLTTVISSLLNAVSILVLGKVYDILAVKLTDWGKYTTGIYSMQLHTNRYCCGIVGTAIAQHY